jgi:hypothetical protein
MVSWHVQKILEIKRPLTIVRSVRENIFLSDFVSKSFQFDDDKMITYMKPVGGLWLSGTSVIDTEIS